MKLALLLGFTGIAFHPASASIYANLETRQVYGLKDGKPLVVITDGSSEVRMFHSSAAIPAGTKDLQDGEGLTSPMNKAGFNYYLEKFMELKSGSSNAKANNQSYNDNQSSPALPVISGSISRKQLNGTSHRYLGMVFTEDEFIPRKPARTIPGRAAYYVPGKPGKLKCKSTGGYQCLDFNKTVCFNNPVQTKCKTVGGSPGYWVPAKAPQYIPAVPARTVTHRRQLTIDCDDQTYDIKNDAKGWKSYWQNSTVSRLAQETCPAISSYPLR